MKRSAMIVLLSVAIAALLPGATAPAERHLVTNESARPMTTDLKAITETALDDAARRSGLTRVDLRVVSAEAVTWPDGSLGCPQPGLLYTQAVVPGYRIRIQAGTEILDFHAGRLGQLVLCPKGRSVEPAPGGPT